MKLALLSLHLFHFLPLPKSPLFSWHLILMIIVLLPQAQISHVDRQGFDFLEIWYITSYYIVSNCCGPSKTAMEGTEFNKTVKTEIKMENPFRNMWMVPTPDPFLNGGYDWKSSWRCIVQINWDWSMEYAGWRKRRDHDNWKAIPGTGQGVQRMKRVHQGASCRKYQRNR